MPAMEKVAELARQIERRRKRVRRVVALLQEHPLASRDRVGTLRRWIWLKAKQELADTPPEVEYAEDARLFLHPGATTVAANHIYGLRDCSEMGLLLHVTRPDDLVLDIGANVGTYTVLAARCAEARVVAVEPAPTTCERLERNIRLNAVEGRVEVVRACAGEQEGTVRFSAGEDAINHVASGATEASSDITVETTTIDAICSGRAPVLIKIDVEGYELPALRGARRTLADERLKVIILEKNSSGERYGFEERELDSLLLAAGFDKCSYDPLRRVLTQGGNDPGCENDIYVRDVDWVTQRVEGARRFRIHGLPI